MMKNHLAKNSLFFLILVLFFPNAQASGIQPKVQEFVLIDDLDNPADDQTGFGAVKNSFEMGKYQITAKIYADFLNSVAVIGDPHHLFDERMATDPQVAVLERTITRQGYYHYQAIAGREDFPITYVDVLCSLRFCNWMEHASPPFIQGETHQEACDAITETGAYTIKEFKKTNGQTSITIDPNLGHQFFLPTEDQWYKAAYYYSDLGQIITYDPQDPIPCVQERGSCGFYADYSTFNDTSEKYIDANVGHTINSSYPICNLPEDISDAESPFYLIPVGSFGEGHHGLCDMGGNVNEWTFPLDYVEESDSSPADCAIRGGSWASPQDITCNDLTRSGRHTLAMTTKNNTTGFRIAHAHKTGYPKPPTSKDKKESVTMAIVNNSIAANKTYEWIGWNAGAFVFQEGIEMACVYEATEGCASLSYLKVMAPIGILTTALDCFFYGIENACAWGAQWLLHMTGDIAGLIAIDSLGTAEAQALARSYGLEEVVHFYNSLHELCHGILDPIKRMFGFRDQPCRDHSHPSSPPTSLEGMTREERRNTLVKRRDTQLDPSRFLPFLLDE